MPNRPGLAESGLGSPPGGAHPWLQGSELGRGAAVEMPAPASADLLPPSLASADTLMGQGAVHEGVQAVAEAVSTADSPAVAGGEGDLSPPPCSGSISKW